MSRVSDKSVRPTQLLDLVGATFRQKEVTSHEQSGTTTQTDTSCLHWVRSCMRSSGLFWNGQGAASWIAN